MEFARILLPGDRQRPGGMSVVLANGRRIEFSRILKRHNCVDWSRRRDTGLLLMVFLRFY